MYGDIITADVAFGAWQYYTVTGDQDFMDKFGYELILDTAKFWASRLEDGEDGLLHINDVVGPDEYKEHVDDNAFTNYMHCDNGSLGTFLTKPVTNKVRSVLGSQRNDFMLHFTQ